MRTVIRAAIILVFVSGPAFAKGKKGAAEAKSGAGMMDSNDPAEKETSDKGPFAPKTEAGEAGDEKARGGAAWLRLLALLPSGSASRPRTRERGAVKLRAH